MNTAAAHQSLAPVDRSEVRRFLVRFGLLAGVLFTLELTPPAVAYAIEPWTRVLATLGGALAAVFYPNTVVAGLTLTNPANGFSVLIAAGCNGVEAVIILSAAIWAFPTTRRARLAGMVIGALAIQGLNVVRVASLFALGQWNMTAFEIAHLYVWQALIMLDVAIVWLLWIRAVLRRPTPDSVSQHA